MKKMILTLLVTLGLVGFTGCMSGMMGGSKCGGDTQTKCQGDDKCGAQDEGEGKCGDEVSEEEADKCGDGKCGK